MHPITLIKPIFSDYDPRVVEQKELQQPACLPLSYVLRFYTEAARKDSHIPRKVTISPPPRTTVTAILNNPTVSRSPPGEMQIQIMLT